MGQLATLRGGNVEDEGDEHEGIDDNEDSELGQPTRTADDDRRRRQSMRTADEDRYDDCQRWQPVRTANEDSRWGEEGTACLLPRSLIIDLLLCTGPLIKSKFANFDFLIILLPQFFWKFYFSLPCVKDMIFNNSSHWECICERKHEENLSFLKRAMQRVHRPPLCSTYCLAVVCKRIYILW